MDRQSTTRQRALGSAGLSRRNIFRARSGWRPSGRGGSRADPVVASPASAAAQATTVEQGALAPAVVGLADAATIAVDASLGNDFRVTIAGNRAMGNPANPADGQKITFQVTQGSGGPYTLSWANGYEFSSGLPQPTLSTTAGQTDLLCFIYNEAKGKWLLAAFVAGFNATTVTPPPGTYRLFPSTNGPASPVSYSGPFICGVVCGVTAGGCWLDGYWWWVCQSGQSTAAQKFALWQIYNGQQGTLVANSVVTSGTLSAGQWNYVQLAAPLPLAIGATYVAATGFNGSFPDTNNQFGSGDPYSAGITSGPLTAYSDASGTIPVAVQDGPERIHRGERRPDGIPADLWLQFLQLLDGRPGRHRSPGGDVLPAVAELPDAPGPPGLRYRRAIPWRRSSSYRSPARWTICGSTPRPARVYCPRGARSGMWPRRRWSRARTTRRRPGRARPGPAGWPALTPASRYRPVTTRWRCSTAVEWSGTRPPPVTGAAGGRGQRYHGRAGHRASNRQRHEPRPEHL